MNEQLKIIISAEVEKLKQGVQDAKNEVKSFKEQVNNASKQADANIQQMGSGIATGMKVATGAIAAGAAALLALGASTAEYRNEQAKLQTAFESAGGSAAEATQTYNDLYRVLGDGGQATEAAAHLAQLTTEEKALNEWTTICQGVYATFGASLPIEGLTEAANETAKVGTVTGTLADALNWAGISEDAFNEKLAACNTEAERETLIRTTLNGLYNDAAAKYEVNNAQILAQNEAQAQLDSTLAKLGETVAPIITDLTTLANDVLSALMPYIQDFAQNSLPVIKDVLSVIADKLKEALDFLLQHKEVLAAVAIVIGTVVTAIGLYNAVAAIKAAMDAAQVTTLGGLIAAQLASAAATMVALAPYIAIAAAIAAVIAIIVLCIKNWDKIKETVINVANAIKTKVTESFNKVKDTISNTINKARDAVKNAIDKIKSFFDFKWEFPKLKMPHFKVTGKFSLDPPSVPKLTIDWYAKGGVFDNTTLFGYGNGAIGGLGENGAEAVVPLENNLGWLNKLADMLAERLGNGGAPVVLQVGEKVLGEVVVSSINGITKQTGSIPLVIA